MCKHHVVHTQKDVRERLMWEHTQKENNEDATNCCTKYSSNVFTNALHCLNQIRAIFVQPEIYKPCINAFTNGNVSLLPKRSVLRRSLAINECLIYLILTYRSVLRRYLWHSTRRSECDILEPNANDYLLMIN